MVTLLEYVEKWKTSEDPLPLLEVYTMAIQSYSKARPYLTSECENVAFVLERLALSCVELLLCLPQELPDKHWEEFQTSVQVSHKKLMEHGSFELRLLSNLTQENGVWKNPLLQSILSQEPLEQERVNKFLVLEGPILLGMRIKHLLKIKQVSQATALAKVCADNQEINIKGSFTQLYLVCLCAASPNIKLMETIANVDCKDALEMICNLESEGDEKTALILCAAFLSRQLQHGEMYCAWELTLFWSKLQQRVDPSIQVYLERCRQLSLLTKTVYHIFFLIKVIQSETEGAGLATCIELCVRALRLDSTENTNVKISVCKTISCLLPDDLEVKRACQLSEFLLEPTVDAYYAVEMLYNQPDQKYDEESLPVPNSLRCELLLVLKTRWPFDPEFWDWKTLKRHCLALMGEEASIVSSIDELNDSEVYEKLENFPEENTGTSINGITNFYGDDSNIFKNVQDEKQKKREIKKMREKGFISARFRNWQAYMQYCVLCDKEFLGHRIVRHAQKHYKDGIYSCPICAKNFVAKEVFVPHVTLHVKQSCKERLAAMKPLRRLGRPAKIPNMNRKANAKAKQEQRPIKKNSLYSEDFIVFNDNDGSDDENDNKGRSFECELSPIQKQVAVNEFSCPVTLCKKGFKYLKNLIAHVRAHRDNEEAKRFLEMQSKKVICHYCRRHFVSVAHLNDHLQMHCGSKPYICIQMKCKAGFTSYAELLTHRKEHPVFRAKCMFPNCGRIFSGAYLLYDHEAQHYNTYTCKFTDCGKVYHSEIELQKHLDDHGTLSKDVLKTEDQTDSYTEFAHLQAEEDPKANGNIEQILTSEPVSSNLSSVMCHTSDEMKTNAAVAKQIQFSTNVSEQTGALCTDGLDHSTSADILSQVLSPSANILDQILLPPTGVLGQGLSPTTGVLTQDISPDDNSLEQGEAAITSSTLKMPPLNSGMHIFMKPSKLSAASSVINTGNALLEQIYTTVEEAYNNSSVPVLPEIKGKSVSQPQVHDVTNHDSQNIARNVGNMVPFNMQSQNLYESSLAMPEFKDTIKAAANLFNLPLKALEDIPFIQPQSSLDTPLPAPSVPQPAPVQKFNCTVEGCTRIYNSIQSIGKHMKTTHPDHYAAFKLERKLKKSQRSRNLVKATSDSKLAFCKPSQVVGPSNSAFPQQTKCTVNPSYSKQVQSITNSLFPTPLNSLASPMLSSVESIIDQGLSALVKSDPETVLNPQAENLANAAFTSQLEAIAKAVLPLKFENGTDPFLPQPAECSSAAGFPSLMGNEKNTVFSHLENNATYDHSSIIAADRNSGFSKEKSIPDTVFPSKVNNSSQDKVLSLNETNSMQTALDKKKDSRGRGPKRERKPKHNTRAKWPAIIRDGKFICSRCFRVFTNPRSLGGHLSKRSYCKSVDEAEISQEDLRSSGKASLLANMILSSSSTQNVQSSPQSVVNPEICLKDQSFLQSLAEDQSTFLQKSFPKLPTSNFNSRLNKSRSKIVKQALETTGIEIERTIIKQESDTIATEIENKTIKQELETTGIEIGSKIIKQTETTGTLENTDMLPLLPPDICIPDATQMNKDVLSKNDLSPLLQDVCKRDTLITDSSKMQKIEECDFHIFSAEDLLKTVENGFSCKPFSNGSVTSKSITSNSSRVSVISSPQSRATAQMNKKRGNSSSKKKKKAGSVLLATSTNQNLLADELTVHPLAKDTEGNDQKSHNLPNFLTNCESQLLQNLTQKLNTDNQICMADTQESIKTNMEPLSVLGYPTIKMENCDSQRAPCSCNIKGHSDLKIPNETIQKLKKTVGRQIMKTKINSKPQISNITNKLVVSSDGQSILAESQQTLETNCNTQLLMANDLGKVTSTDITQVSACAAAINSNHAVNSSLSEVLHKDDTQVMDILERLQKLKLENDIVIANIDCNTSLSIPANALLPVTTVSTQPETDLNQLLDKINKPFVCREQDCIYSAMTKDALFKHYSKVHQYTYDMVMEIKKNQLKFAPFRCVVPSCPKTFTRNSNLRAHCQSVHHFTSEEMVKLKIKRPYGRRSLNETDSTTQTVGIKKLKTATIKMEKRSEPLLVTEGMKEVRINCGQELESKQEYLPGVVTVSQDKAKVLSSIKKNNRELKGHKNPKARRESKVRREFKGRKDLKGLQELKGVKGIKELKGNKIRRHRKEREGSKRKRPEQNDSSFPGIYSPYRPYRCVHQGCVAAFTIQQNLILHYQAVHKSELPNFSLQIEEDSDLYKEECDDIEIKEGVKEFRCQESDCSRIFQEVASLIQHYIKLHELIPEEIESMMSFINFGKFSCDQLQCTCTFTTPCSYISHLEIDHGIKIKQKVEEDCIYKCDCEGCDRVYATRSNLLRHIYNKHSDKHKAHLIRPRKLRDDDDDADDENVLANTIEEKLLKVKHRTKIRLEKEPKATKTKQRKICSDSKNSQSGQVRKNKPLISLKCGKHNYSIKTRNEALLECSDKLTTQYPCMIKECSSVVTSQRNIIRHYKCHRLSRAFVLQNKNILIICKRKSSSHAKVFPLDQEETEDKKHVAKESDTYLSESSDELSTSSQSERGKDEMDELAELFITKLINEDSKGCNNQTMSSSSTNSDIQETSSCSSEKQRASKSKRAKKEKYVSPNKRIKVESHEELSATEVSSTHSGEETSIAIQNSEEPPPFDWSSFKPMGFEVSFLKFLEESAVKQKKNMDRDANKGSLLSGRKSNEKIVLEDSNQSWTSSESETFVQFANPSKLQFCENVQIVLDKTLKDITELVLKQLQEMKPTVVLEEIEEHQDGSVLTVAKKLSFDSEERSRSTDNVL
uniref:Zinc finger protein 292 isoform X2 n=1 Tax=Geotrypetes seraphini TaxID=260995 RepID=A0A6P8PYJ3_GEOSA|nr:zinc finger protein 292 isoform X2 [Geotrypetes seraphini]